MSSDYSSTFSLLQGGVGFGPVLTETGNDEAEHPKVPLKKKGAV